MPHKGLMGGLTKAFIGKQAIEGMEIGQNLMQNGADATAEVLSITDTGATVNMNPVVVLVMKVTPSAGAEFQTAAQVVAPRIAVPRVGDKIKIKYNPTNPSQVIIV